MSAERQKTITVVIPTLNEGENIDSLLAGIFRVRQNSGLDFSVLFVDSASTDDTCDKILGWQHNYPVFLRCKDVDVGLAGAVIDGARNTEADIVLVMDADLSHSAEAMPLLLAPVIAGTHDMVFGSRYVDGGATPDWPLLRRLCSKIATLPALLFCKTKDPLSGFFAVRRELLADLPGAVPGFKIGLAILAEYGRSLRVKEVPIEFRDRDFGESKMSCIIVVEYVKQLAGLTINWLRRSRKR